MSVDAIRQELDAFGADSAAIADGDKDTLVSELLNARAFSKPHFSPAEGAPSDAAQSPSGGGGTSSPPAPPAPPPPAAADEEGLAEAAYAAALAEAMQMKVKELRGALAARNVGWADCLEKQELAARLAGLVAASAGFSASGGLSPGQVGEVTAEQLRQEMADGRSPLLVDVYATWCGPCKLIAPMLSRIAQRLGCEARVCKLDSDAEPDLSSELRVAGLPTLLFFAEGREVHRLEGVPGNEDALAAIVREHLGVEV